MKVSTKAIIILVILVCLTGAGLVAALVQHGKVKGKAQADKAKLQAELASQKTINENLVRAQANMVSKGDLNTWMTDHMNDIKGDLKEIDADLVSVSRATGRLGRSTSRPSRSGTVKLVGGSPELSNNITWASEDGDQELPWAWAKVKPLGDDTDAVHARLVGILGPENATLAMNGLVAYMEEPENAVWTTGTETVEFEVTAAVAETKEGLQTQYVQLWAKNPVTEERVPLAIMDASFLYTDPQAPEFRWVTHVDGGITGGVTPQGFIGGGSIGLTFAAHGVTDDDNDWRFLRVGVATDGETGWGELGIVGYNLGKRLPLVDDVWVWPSGVVSQEGYGASISLTSTW